METTIPATKLEGNLATAFTNPALYNEWKKHEEEKQKFFMSLFEQKKESR